MEKTSLTVDNVKSKLYSYFLENNSFDMKRDFLTLHTVTLSKEEDEAITICALDELVKADFLRKAEIKKESIYFLTKPINSYSRTVSFNGDSAIKICTIINIFADKTNNDSIRCNPLHLDDMDFQNLISIAAITVMDKPDTENEDDE